MQAVENGMLIGATEAYDALYAATPDYHCKHCGSDWCRVSDDCWEGDENAAHRMTDIIAADGVHCRDCISDNDTPLRRLRFWQTLGDGKRYGAFLRYALGQAQNVAIYPNEYVKDAVMLMQEHDETFADTLEGYIHDELQSEFTEWLMGERL